MAYGGKQQRRKSKRDMDMCCEQGVQERDGAGLEEAGWFCMGLHSPIHPVVIIVVIVFCGLGSSESH